MSKKPTIEDQILELLSDGEKWADEIVESVSAQSASIRVSLWKLVKSGVILRVKRGVYCQKPLLGGAEAVENPRNASDNVKTINTLLTLSETYLDDLCARWDTLSEKELTVSELNAFCSDFKTSALLIDKLMHRWYVVDRGYDANPAQARADVERKSAANEGQPADMNMEVGHYFAEIQELSEVLEKLEKKKK